jgi:hypothetical protein
VAIARVLSAGPSLILADEPTGGFCQHSRQQVSPVLSDGRRRPVMRLPRWPARSRSSGDGAVCGDRRERADGGSSEGGERCGARRRLGRTGRPIWGT